MALMVFVDETGDHSMDVLDKDFPVFVLAFLLCEEKAYSNEIVPAFTSFKVEQFGHDGVILHSRDIRKCMGSFAFLQAPENREQFQNRVNGLEEGECTRPSACGSLRVSGGSAGD